MSLASHSWGSQGDPDLSLSFPDCSFPFQHSSCRTSSSINIVLLGKWKSFGRLSCAVHAICLDFVALRVDLHLRPSIVELHVLFANSPAILHWLDSFLQVI